MILKSHIILPVANCETNNVIFHSGGVKELHGHPIAYAFDGVVKDLVCITSNKKTVKKLFYQTLAMPLHELENKKPFKVRISIRTIDIDSLARS